MITLTESEWRTIHNALAVYQCSFRALEQRKDIQLLMDKVRDEAIAVSSESEDSADARNKG